MKITPLDVRKQEFKKVMRGYDPIEVDSFKEQLVNEFENLLKEQSEQRTKITELETQLKDFRQMERALQQTLMQAQEATGKSYEAARRDAESIIKSAEVKASQMLSIANVEMGKLNNEIVQLKARKDSFIGRMRVLLSSELDLIKALEVGSDPILANDSTQGTGKDGIDLDNILKAIEDVGTPETH